MATRMREKTAKRHENADRRPQAVARLAYFAESLTRQFGKGLPDAAGKKEP